MPAAGTQRMVFAEKQLGAERGFLDWDGCYGHERPLFNSASIRARTTGASSSSPMPRPDLSVEIPPIARIALRLGMLIRTSSIICPALSSKTPIVRAEHAAASSASYGKGHKVIGRNSPTLWPSA